MICHKCGKFIAEDAKFCSNCGEKIDWEAEKEKQAEQQVKNTSSEEHIALDTDVSVGKGLKAMAWVYLISGIIGTVILGAKLMDFDETTGFVIIIAGSVVSIVNYWLFAGYGVIVDKLVKIEHNTRKR